MKVKEFTEFNKGVLNMGSISVFFQENGNYQSDNTVLECEIEPDVLADLFGDMEIMDVKFKGEGGGSQLIMHINYIPSRSVTQTKVVKQEVPSAVKLNFREA